MRKSSKLSIYQKLKKLANSNDLDLFFEGCKSKTDDFQFETEKMMIYFDQQVVDLYQEIEKKGSSDLLKVVYVLAKLSKPVAKRTLDPGMATSFFEYPSEMFELNSNSSTFVNDELERKDLHLFSICDGFGAFKNIAGEHLSLPKLLKETTLIPSRVKKSLAKAQVESVVKGTKDAVDRHEHKSNYRAALDLYLKRSLLAWDAQTVPQYQTETNYYRGIYEKFILHPYLTRQDLNLVPQADLIDKLFNALLGIESDLFTFSKPDMFKLDFIRLETVGSKALMQFLSKFLKSARVLKNLQDYSEKVAFRSLTGESLSSSLELIIRIIHINVINLQANHQRTPTTLLQLYIILEPIQTLCKELESDFLTNPQSNLSILLSQLYTRIISLQPENPYTPYIVWIFQKSTQPLFKFISGWIGNCPIDPFNEFFIVDNQYLPDRVPNFIPSSLSKRIFELHNIDNSLQLHTEFCPEWIIEDNERNEYLFKFEQMVAFNRDMYRDNYFKAQLEHWNELQADLDRRVAERGHQQVRLQQANANLDYQREVVNNRKKELKKSVEAFLEERKEFKAKMEEFNRLEDQRELSALEQKNLERERLMDIERNEIVSRFEAALKLLEKKEMVVDWRQKRIELNPQRNTKLAEPWDSNELCIPEFVLPVFEEVDATTQPQEEHESFYSAEINISKESICNLDDNSNETNAAEEVMIMPNNLPIVKDIEVRDNASQDAMTDIIAEDSLSCPPSPASVETLLPVPHESLRTEGFVVDAKELNDLNWVIYPGTISSCFGVANDVYTKDPSQQAFVEIQRLKSALLNLDSKIQLLEDTFESSVLSIWKTELKLISFSFISCFFSPKGVESAQDFRFHLSLIKDYFLLGSPQFSMGLTDAMFKASPHGLNLNGPHSNGIVSELNMLLLEILKPVEWLDFDIASLVNGKSDINKGVNVSTALRLNYDPPAPLDIIITESAVSRLSSIFSFLLLIFQAQEAIERIYQSPRWKALKHLKENNAQNAIMIRFIHMAHVFLTSLEHYVFQSAVNSPWDYFLNQVEDLVSSSSILSFDVNSKASIENLQFQFENCTNEILWRLFLFDRDQRLLSNQLAFLLKLLIEFSRSVQTSGHTTSFARLYFDFDAGFKSLLYLLKDSFQKEEFSDVAYQRSFEPFYELFIGLGGAI